MVDGPERPVPPQAEGSDTGPPSAVATSAPDQQEQASLTPTSAAPAPSGRGVKGVLSRLRPSGTQIPGPIDDIVQLLRTHHPRSDPRPVVRAYEVAESAHHGQRRKSGEDFISHPVGVARILAEQGMESTSIITAFLHDAVEDTQLTLEDVREDFGDEVAELIDGLTKIEKIGMRSKEQEKATNLRKMIVAMARDIRVLIIKLADRLHNMRTIDALDAVKRELVAQETLDIYAPLAHRLGMQQIKAELEDLAFKTLHPKPFAEIERMVRQRQPEREKYLSSVVSEVQRRLREAGVKASITGRPKHFYSIYEKMVGRGREFDEIFDLVGIRILVEHPRECYAGLGAIHSLWRPVPGRFKDYIAMPKFNLYRSLHTTVVGPEGKPLEVQIRSEEMHREAEWGVASHWQYKEDPGEKSSEEQTAWMRRMIELEQTEDDGEFLDTLRLDLFRDEVFVFTPKGDVVELSKGSTPIDFAYAIHTEVGHACVGARVDGKLVPLSYQLSSGETVEVISSKTSNGPSRDWLDIVVTPRARTKIKQWFTKERREEAAGEGKEALMKACRRAGIPMQQVMSEKVLADLGPDLRFANLEAMYVALGEGRVSAQTIVQRAVRSSEVVLEEEEEILLPPRLRTRPPTTEGVIVKGIDEILVKLARCCMPVPGDAIIGFVTRGRGVSIHRSDCPNAKDFSGEGERLVEVEWDPRAAGIFPVTVRLEALDRPKLLRDVTTVISDFGVNISSASSVVGNGLARLEFTFEITNPAQLANILNNVRKIEAVYDVYRVTPR